MTDYRAAVVAAGNALAQARQDQAAALDAVRVAALDAIEDGMTEREAARMGQIDRMTVRKWRGKR